MSNTKVVLAFILVAVTCFALGRLTVDGNSVDKVAKGQVLREDGYQLVSPLLLTDHGNDQTSPALQTEADKLSGLIDEAVATNELSTGPVYYRNLKTGEQINVNGDIKYFPASLSKVPLMMAYYKLAESNPSLLTTPKRLELTQNHNAGQEIPPVQSPQSGNEYTLQQLIDYMIKYSDNASFNLLFDQVNSDNSLRAIFDDLELFYPYSQTMTKDVFTPKEFSRFLRLLYNATYLNEKDSERALKLMSDSAYRNGIVAGVGKEVTVAHKFGINTQRDTNGVLQGRQLHDCGIIYKPSQPYLLCIMTKSGAGELAGVEQVIADISRYVYTELADAK